MKCFLLVVGGLLDLFWLVVSVGFLFSLMRSFSIYSLFMYVFLLLDRCLLWWCDMLWYVVWWV